MTISRILFASLALTLGCALAAPPSTAPVRLRLGPDGEILAWLASGPFPNVGALELKGTGFATDYLAGEAGAAATEGAFIPKVAAEQSADPALINRRRPGWLLAIGSTTNGVDLVALLNGSKPAIAYLYTTLLSPTSREAEILFGSDDGAKVYVNGRLVFQKQIARGIKRDEDRVPIHLEEGPNRILFKIEQGNGGWGLLARVADLRGKAFTDVREQLDVESQSSPGWEAGVRWLRKSAGEPGSLDFSAAIRYDEASVRAHRWLQRFRAEAENPARLESVLRTAESRIARDSDADALSGDLANGSRAIQRDYDRSRQRLIRLTQQATPLFRTAVQREDYARVMPGGRYFVHADGRPLIPIGYNHNPDWPEFEEANPERANYSPQETARYMAHLKASGVNVIRMMIETPPTGNLENPIGTFSPEHVRWVDTIVSEARKNGIKLIVTPWDTFWMNLRFDTTPYNPARGGLLKRRIDFITSPVLRVQEKRRIRYLIDRWGNSGTIFSWELLNEADLWWGATPGQLREWINDVSRYARAYEHKKWGRNHLLSVSIAEPMPKGALAVDAYQLPTLDYATTHLYIGASRAPTEPIGPALAIRQGVRYSLGQIKDRRPYMDTENGPIDRWIESAVLDDKVFRGMIWAHLASGAAGSGFRWPYRNPHHLTEGMLSSLKAMSEFARVAPWKSLAGDRVPFSTTGAAATCGFATSTSAIVWTSGSPTTLTWPTGPRHISLQTFDCTTAHWLPARILERTGSQLSLTTKSIRATAYILTKSP